MYESFYGLTGKPFQLSPDPAFFFGSKGHRRAMAYLEYGIHQGEGFIVITGEVGAGKTTLIRSLFQRLPEKNLVAVQLVSTQLDADDVLRMVAGAFGLPVEGMDKSSVLMRLERFLRSLQSEGKRALLIVDEAQNLTPRAVEELRMLSNFQHESRSLLQSFLVGQPEFRDIMRRAEMQQLRQRVIASYHLGPLDREETENYVLHRLRLVGWNGDPSFEPAVFDRIHTYTAGVPRQINTLCDRLLLAAYLAETHAIGPAELDEVIAELREEFSVATTPIGTRSEATAQTARNGSFYASGIQASSGVSSLAQTEAPRLPELEGRVSLLESSINAVYSQLKKILPLLQDRSHHTDKLQ